MSRPRPTAIGLMRRQDPNPIVAMLQHMSESDVAYIYSGFSDVHLTNLVYYPIFNMEGRDIIYVESLEVDGVITSVSCAFYRSSGISRATGLAGIWLPTTHLTYFEDYRISKPEDEFIYKYSSIAYSALDPEQQMLTKYMRFINRTNAMVSYFLSHYEVKLEIKAEDLDLPKVVGTIYYTQYIDAKQKSIIMGQQPR